MGTYLNCGNEAFRLICNGIYVDKTGLIEYINNTIETPENLTCFSRPRRFGKSYAAMMLAAYYDKSCDSRELFSGLEIEKAESFEKHLNQYNVIYLDITWFISIANGNKSIVKDIQVSVIDELRNAFPDCIEEKEAVLQNALLSIYQKNGEKFFVIIDEWDALFREAKDDMDVQKSYIQLLRGLFKGGPAMKAAIAGAYMTGILPIKKYGTQSALTDFQEYTMVNPDMLAPYIGFTEFEVKELCVRYDADFNEMKCWYDGYSFRDTDSIYSPNSVMSAIRKKSYRSYWTSSETYESLKDYISMDLDGLKDSVIAMLGGQKQKVETLYFQNDMTSLTNRDHVLTLLVHLGYLAYDEIEKKVYIPNLEVSDSFKLAVSDAGWENIGKALSDSDDLLEATIKGDSEAVERALEEIHSAKTSILAYNDENSLACAIYIAYYTAERYYELIREFPSGKGFADIVFLPHKNTDKPAMIIELKYDKSADTAIQQIKDNRYAGKLKDYKGNLLLVGINYDKNATGEHAKKHTCIIEKA